MTENNNPSNGNEPLPETPKDEKPGKTASNWDDVNTDTVFYYSRDRRLSRASADVRSMNDGKPIRPSLSRTLFATGAHRIIFIAIIFTILAFSFASRFSARGGDDSIKLGGNTLATVITREEGILILGVVKTMPKSGEAYVGAVDLSVSPVLSNTKEGGTAGAPQIFSHRISFNPVETETYQISLPFDGNDFLVTFKNDSEQKSFRLKVKS